VTETRVSVQAQGEDGGWSNSITVHYDQASYDPTAATAHHKWCVGQWLLYNAGATISIRQAPVAVPQIRMRLPARLRKGLRSKDGYRQVAGLLQHRAPALDTRHLDPRRGLWQQNRTDEISSL